MSKTAIVTGASSGLGRAIASSLLAEGWRVVGVARGSAPPSLAESARLVWISGTVAADSTVDAAFAVATADGDLRLVVSCAGVGVFGPAGSYDRAKADQVIEGNLIGLMLFSDRAFQTFREKRVAGTILNVISTAAHASRPAETFYTAAKWGSRGYTEALRSAAKGSGIRVVAAYPGGMNTPFWANAVGSEVDSSAFPSADEVAKTLVAALDGGAAYVSDIVVVRS